MTLSQKQAPPVIRTLLSGCCYCKQSHQPSSCVDVTDIEVRKQILRKKVRFYVCLRQNQITHESRSSVRSCQCNRKHHCSSCDRNSQDKTTPAHQVTPKPLVLKSRHSSITSDSCTTMYGNTKQVRARIILDGGSQRSYITNW